MEDEERAHRNAHFQEELYVYIYEHNSPAQSYALSATESLSSF
jgi:hypothetical protein